MAKPCAPLLTAQTQQTATGDKAAVLRVKNRIAFKMRAMTKSTGFGQPAAQIVQICIRKFAFHFQRHYSLSSALGRR